jgi:transcriptional regulator GlxA family with amidase domain
MTNHALASASPAVETVGFLLVPGFALMSYASAMEPLRAGNVLAGREIYRWRHLSPDGRKVAASNGVTIVPDHDLRDHAALRWLVICAGGNPALFDDPATLAWLRTLARRGVRMAGVSGGPYLLARAGLLDGYRCTIHWEHLSSIREEFPHLDVTGARHEIDRDRMTCAGGIAALDMMHERISRDHGTELAARVSEWFLQTDVREGQGPQRMSLSQRLGVSSPRLQDVVARMEASIEEPVSRAELARVAGISLRQLERLFAAQMQTSVSAYYLGIRLERARSLLRQTAMPITEISVACGFASPAHFSRSYRRRFGRPPNAERASRRSSTIPAQAARETSSAFRRPSR